MPDSSTLIIGGEENSRKQSNSIEKLINRKWKTMKPLTETISRHCAVQVEGKDIFLIGGHIGSEQFSDKVIRFNAETHESAVLRTTMKRGRQLHACAPIDYNKVIVVGGRSLRGTLKSVELFDPLRLTWTEPKNLELPLGISYAEIVKHPAGKLVK